MKEFAAHIFRHVPFLQVILIILFVIQCPFSVHPALMLRFPAALQIYRGLNFIRPGWLPTLCPCLGSGFVDSGSGSSILDWITIRIQGFNGQKLKKIYSLKFFICFFDRKLQYTYSIFVGHFCSPGSGSTLSDWIRIQTSKLGVRPCIGSDISCCVAKYSWDGPRGVRGGIKAVSAIKGQPSAFSYAAAYLVTAHSA